MIFLDAKEKEKFRPTSFSGKQVEAARKTIESYLLIKPAERRQTDVPPVWKMELNPDVLSALLRWSNGRCAFCEQSRDDITPYRFRPPGYPEPLLTANGKDAYLALAFAWSNMFPICGGCRPDNPAYFPVSGSRTRTNVGNDPGLDLRESAGLFYPGEPDFGARAFRMTTSGEYLAIGPKARRTIDHFHLNRPELVTDRAQHLRRFIETLEPDLDPQVWMATFTDLDFGGPAYLYLRRLVQLVAQIADVPPPRSLDPARLQGGLIKWRSRIDLHALLGEAAETLSHDDQIEIYETAPGSPARTIVLRNPDEDQLGYRIKAVRITTFKSLEDIAFELPATLPPRDRSTEPSVSAVLPDAPCLLILGENATGKSSILEAIALACLSEEAIEEMGVEGGDLTLNPEYMGGEQQARIRDSRIEIDFHNGETRSLAINGRSGSRRPFRHAGHLGERPLMFAYGAHRLYGGTRRRGARRHYDTLFFGDRDLSNPEAWLRGLARSRPRDLDEVVSALRHIIQIDGAFETINFPAADPEGGGIIRIRKHRPNDEPLTVPQPLKVVSSGYRAILALVCDVLEGLSASFGGDIRAARMAPAIILIDEIEAHLHPRWKLNIIAGLRQALPNATFIITTHDPLCLRGMFNGEVMALNRYHNAAKDGLALPERVERVKGFDTVETMTVEQLLTSDLFQLLSTDDRQTEADYARMADILANEKADALDLHDAAALDKFRSEISDALPFGRGEIPMLVQQAVAEFLRDRRRVDASTASKARERAKDEIKKHLRDLLE